MTDTSEPYRCTCPPTDDPDVEIEQALACWRRQQEHEALPAGGEIEDE